ncbi:MAG TPA: pyridoxal-phosphate dependent enzyme [Bryobacteraceae bacterium]|nr:pyridoxal-phosphate dependent enzyme [Bryobacteraceae bacterium]
MDEVTIDDIRQAAARIQPYIHRTPVTTSRLFNVASGVDAHFKCENLQHGGAFKLRGGANFLLSMPDAEIGRGVVAFSSGNHAQAVAIAAAIRKTKATLVMPSDAPQSKVAATQAYGGTVVRFDRMKDDREAIGRRISEETGATLVPPFDHPWIIAGQGTAALELLEDTAGLDALAVCVGGGGLLSGSAIAAKALRPSIRVFGVEPAIANDWQLSMKAGHQVAIPPPETIADGLRSPKPGNITFPIVKRLVEQVVLVSEEEIVEAMKFLLLRMKILVEPSGAVAAAAVLFRKLPPDIRRVGVILSGGNVDWELLRSL